MMNREDAAIAAAIAAVEAANDTTALVNTVAAAGLFVDPMQRP